MPEIDTLNKYGVGAQGQRLVILNNGSLLREGILSKADAFNLAAWLVTMAVVLPGDEKFEDVLNAIQNA